MNSNHSTSETSPQRVIVLGASGFVGSNLIEFLSKQNVENIGLSSSDLDLCSSGAATQLGEVIQVTDSLVVISAITPDKGRDIHTFMRNLSMIEHLCQYLKESPCAHVVYISSDAVYDDYIHPIREDSCCEPSSFHGLMHLARERMLLDTLQNSATPLMILRPSLLYGTNDTHNAYGPNRFIRLAKEGKNISLFGNGEEKRDHVIIRDLSAIIGLCLQNRTNGILNVATGSSESFADVAKQVVELHGKGINVEFNPRVNPIIHRHFDTTNIIKAFPSFTMTPLSIGLAETASSN